MKDNNDEIRPLSAIMAESGRNNAADEAHTGQNNGNSAEHEEHTGNSDEALIQATLQAMEAAGIDIKGTAEDMAKSMEDTEKMKDFARSMSKAMVNGMHFSDKVMTFIAESYIHNAVKYLDDQNREKLETMNRLALYMRYIDSKGSHEKTSARSVQLIAEKISAYHESLDDKGKEKAHGITGTCLIYADLYRNTEKEYAGQADYTGYIKKKYLHVISDMYNDIAFQYIDSTDKEKAAKFDEIMEANAAGKTIPLLPRSEADQRLKEETDTLEKWCNVPAAACDQIRAMIPGILKESAYVINKGRVQGNYAAMPGYIAVPTARPYVNSLSFHDSGAAISHLLPVKLNGNTPLKIDNGTLYLNGQAIFSEDALREAGTNKKIKLEDISTYDWITLLSLYSIKFYNYEKFGKTGGIKIKMTDYCEYTGRGRNISQRDIETIVERMERWNGIIAIRKNRRGGSLSPFFDVCHIGSFDDTDNSITFSSPYMDKLIQDTKGYAAGMIDDNGEPIKVTTKKKYRKKKNAGNAFIDYPELAKEKNKSAVTNVINIIKTIKQSGYKYGVPHIAARKLIDDNPTFKASEQRTARNHRSQLYKRVFTKTWELLRKSNLEKDYPGIVLPDPKDKGWIPTLSTVNDIVFEFPVLKGYFVGGKMNGKTKTLKELQMMAAETATGPKFRKELQGLPIIPGYDGPIWIGKRDLVRYEVKEKKQQ